MPTRSNQPVFHAASFVRSSGPFATSPHASAQSRPSCAGKKGPCRDNRVHVGKPHLVMTHPHRPIVERCAAGILCGTSRTQLHRHHRRVRRGICALVPALRLALTYRLSPAERELVADFKQGVANEFDIKYRELLSRTFEVQVWAPTGRKPRSSNDKGGSLCSRRESRSLRHALAESKRRHQHVPGRRRLANDSVSQALGV